jgi:hypothetical protein
MFLFTEDAVLGRELPDHQPLSPLAVLSAPREYPRDGGTDPSPPREYIA